MLWISVFWFFLFCWLGLLYFFLSDLFGCLCMFIIVGEVFGVFENNFGFFFKEGVGMGCVVFKELVGFVFSCRVDF